MKIFLLAAALPLFVFSSEALAQNSAGDAILGIYEAVGDVSREKSRVEFCRNGDSYEARIVWLEHPHNEDGTPRADSDNSDPQLRKRPIVGILLVWDLKWNAGKGIWEAGHIYNPVGGKTYDVNMEFDSSGRLKVRGYLGRPMLGKTYYWDKVTE